MMKRLATIPVLAFCLCGGAGAALADEMVTRKDGTEIVLRDDGTWTTAPEIAALEDKKDSGSCDEVTELVTDKMTGNTFLSGKASLTVTNDRKSGFSFSLMGDGKGFTIINSKVTGGSGCIEEHTRVYLLFQSGERIQLKADNKFTCDGRVPLYFGGVFGKESQLDKITTNKIAAMRIMVGKSFIEADFSREIADQFQRILQCLRRQ